jgi:hypothetical protein
MYRRGRRNGYGLLAITLAVLAAALWWASAHRIKSPIVPIPEEPAKTATYSSPQYHFRLTYPTGYSLDTNYVYQGLGPDKPIPGIKVSVPEAYVNGTNLSKDTGLSVEVMEGRTGCDASWFLANSTKGSSESGSISYNSAQNSEGAAGNQYQEYVWAATNSSPCTAIRYFIHTTNIQNYPPGTVKEYDDVKLMDDFAQMRQAFVLLR